MDMPMNKRFAGDVTTAQTKNGKPAKKKQGPTASPSPSPTDGAKAEKDAENGLCT